MNRSPALDSHRVPRRLLAADWARLTEKERDQVLEAARSEGRRAARWYLAEATDDSGDRVSLRCSRWAEAHEDLSQLNDDTFSLYARAQTLASEDDYFAFIIEAHCPEQSARWWETPRMDRLADPRVCAFCEGYERERCQIVGVEGPPTGMSDLQRCLEEAKEQERERGRYWLGQTEEPALSEAEESQRFVVRWEYQRCTLATDLAQMLLDAALHRARLRRASVGPCDGGGRS